MMTTTTYPQPGDLLFYVRQQPNQAFVWEKLFHVAVIMSYDNGIMHVAHVTNTRDLMTNSLVRFIKDTSYYVVPLAEGLRKALHAFTSDVLSTERVYYNQDFADPMQKNSAKWQAKIIAEESTKQFEQQIPRVLKYTLRGKYLVGNQTSHKAPDRAAASPYYKGMMCSQLVATLLQVAYMRASNIRDIFDKFDKNNAAKNQPYWISNKYCSAVKAQLPAAKQLIQYQKNQYNAQSIKGGYAPYSLVLSENDFTRIEDFFTYDFPQALKFNPKHVTPASLLYHLIDNDGGSNGGYGQVPVIQGGWNLNPIPYVAPHVTRVGKELTYTFHSPYNNQVMSVLVRAMVKRAMGLVATLIPARKKLAVHRRKRGVGKVQRRRSTAGAFLKTLGLFSRGVLDDPRVIPLGSKRKRSNDSQNKPSKKRKANRVYRTLGRAL